MLVPLQGAAALCACYETRAEKRQLECNDSSDKCHASSNKCLTSSNKKLLVTSASLLVDPGAIAIWWGLRRRNCSLRLLCLVFPLFLYFCVFSLIARAIGVLV